MGVGTKLAIHSPFTHADARDWELLDAMDLRSCKLFNDSYTSYDRMQWLYGRMPNTLFMMRDFEMSEQYENLWNRPTETGVAHARDWIAWRDNGRFGQRAWKDIPNFDPNRTVVLGINEPSLYGHLKHDHPTYRQNVAAVVNYTVAFLDTLKAAGMKGGALNLSVGWPDNTGPNTRVAWEDYAPIEATIKRGGHYLVLHEYFGNTGIYENLGWWVGRYRQCPWDLGAGKIIIGEGGYDKGVYWGWQPPRGWQGNMNAEQYIRFLREYDTYIKDDPRIHSAQIYTWDYGNNEWETFSVRAMREQFLTYVNSVKTVPDTNRVTTFPTYPAGVINPLPPTGGGGEVPPPAPQPDALKTHMLTVGESKQVIRFNRQAALQKEIFDDDLEAFHPNSPEFYTQFNGKLYVGQRAENGRGAVRVYYCLSGDWANVEVAERAA